MLFYKYRMFEFVTDFENKVSEFFGAKYAVATDCCTHAIELALRHTQANDLSIPVRTYISVPMTLMKLQLRWQWRQEDWKHFYQIGNSNIIDAATLWKENSYIPGSFMCVSFQFNKHLSLGRGGVILLDSQTDFDILKKMSYDGRDLTQPWAEQDIEVLGYHYYMTPETAKIGLKKFQKAKRVKSRDWTYQDYPHLPSMTVFSEKTNQKDT
jgi:dTDP-4-amino-4,6-dideoxygalactose transaminase